MIIKQLFIKPIKEKIFKKELEDSAVVTEIEAWKEEGNDSEATCGQR